MRPGKGAPLPGMASGSLATFARASLRIFGNRGRSGIIPAQPGGYRRRRKESANHG